MYIQLLASLNNHPFNHRFNLNAEKAAGCVINYFKFSNAINNTIRSAQSETSNS